MPCCAGICPLGLRKQGEPSVKADGIRFESSGVIQNSLCVILFRSYLIIIGTYGNSVGYCAISRKVAGSILDGVIEIISPFGRTMILGSTHPLREMSTRNISWG